VAIVFQHPRHFCVSSNFLSEAMHGVCEECIEQGVDVLLHTKPSLDPVDEANALSDGRVDGVLMLRDEGDPTLEALLERGFPLVLFFSRSNEPNVSYVDCDNFMGGKLAASHLIALGHKRLGAVLGPKNSVDSTDRFHGFRAAAEAAGLTIQPHHVFEEKGPDRPLGNFGDMIRSDDRPTGLFVWSDDVAFMCMQEVRAAGLRIPQDISIVGFDSTSACLNVDPPLTSVQQPIIAMARRATRILVSMIADKGFTPQQIVFPPQLDVRGSTSPPSV